ncbi:MAG: ABC transporter ATP-binding protein [Bacteroidetes bacterium]|nr:ABC transporter ATP-binding protein [Bacteroidota bacterium]
MHPVISVQHLSKEYKNIHAVNDLSFTVNEGDVYGFLGQNGAGKSTTIRMLLTLVRPTAGKIELFGQNLFTHRNKVLRNIGAVIENPDVYQYLSACNNLKLFARMSGIHPTTNQLMEQLDMVGLKDRADDKVQTYSQGMRQRLGIAIALIHDPQLIILDEPTNGLDPQGIADIRNLILHLSRNKKKTLLISSHLLSEMEQVATRLLIIDKGKKLVEGNAETLFDPAQTVIELETLNNEAARIQLSNSQWQQALQPQRNDKILMKMHRDQIPELNVWLVQNDIRVVGLQSRHSLEDYFLQVTNGTQHVATFTN